MGMQNSLESLDGFQVTFIHSLLEFYMQSLKALGVFWFLLYSIGWGGSEAQSGETPARITLCGNGRTRHRPLCPATC